MGNKCYSKSDGFHFCLTSYHTKEIIDLFIADLKDVILKQIAIKKIKYSPCLLRHAEKINDTEIIKDVISYLNCINGI